MRPPYVNVSADSTSMPLLDPVSTHSPTDESLSSLPVSSSVTTVPVSESTATLPPPTVEPSFPVATPSLIVTPAPPTTTPATPTMSAPRMPKSTTPAPTTSASATSTPTTPPIPTTPTPTMPKSTTPVPTTTPPSNSSHSSLSPSYRKSIHHPIISYNGLDHPLDHINKPALQKRLDVLIPIEQEVIANYSRLHTYRREFYKHCFDSLVPLSRKNKKTPLRIYGNNVYLGVKRTKQGECEGCLRKTPIHMGNISNLIRKFVGNQEVFNIITNNTVRYPPQDAPFEVTAVVTTSTARLFMLPQILSRWPGRFVIVISTSVDMQQLTVDFLGSLFLPSRVTTIVYTVESSVFPINLLRNLGIRNIETSHFIVLDMDLMLSRNLHDKLNKLPSWLKESNNSAVVIPLFFLSRDKILRYCSHLEDCLPLNIPLIPQNKSDLIQCLNSSVCQMRKKFARTHLYVMPSWFGVSQTSVVSQMDCAFTDFQEPYVILKYTPSTPMYDERFVNYGYNKLQLIEHLRSANYQFFLLNHAFMTDLAHEDSSYRNHYQSKGFVYIWSVYREFQKQLNNRYPFSQRFPICDQSSFIDVLTPI